MRVDSTITLITVLLAVTLLGVIIGFCLGLLRGKRKARQAIEQVNRAMTQRQAALEVDLASSRTLASDQKQAMTRERALAQKAQKRESALEMHSQLQAQRIQTLESQVRVYEEQQIKLKRDFAKYKSDKNRELAQARSAPTGGPGERELPVLQKRIGNSTSARNRQATAPEDQQAAAERQQRSRRNSRGMSAPLSRELEIPALAESELPDSVEDLEFDLIDQDSIGDLPRG